MKKLLFCLGLFIFVAASYYSNAQSVIEADDDNNFNNYYQKNLSTGKQAMPYAYLRETDVVWEHAIWRTIDFREKFNQFFYFPIDASQSQGRVSLTNAIIKGLEQGEFEVFTDDDMKIPKTYEEIMSSLLRSDTQTVEDYDDYGDVIGTRQVITTDEFHPEDVYSISLKEYWYVDKQDTRQKVRIVAMALKYNYCRMRGDELKCDVIPLFWVPMNDMRVRNWLVKINAYDPNNSHAERSYDDIFIDRYFDSFVTRESNTMNREIASYLTGTDAILESQAIEDKIFDIESDMWEY